MKILSIETSCDETAAAIVENGRKIITNIVSSSQELHKKTGGIIPETAAREQVKCMIPVLSEALQKTNNKKQITKKINKNNLLSVICYLLSDIDAIAVTTGPGLIGSLLVGVETAKTIATVCGKQIIPVNHIFAHIYANWLKHGREPEFPAISLVVSGGHTELFLMKGHIKISWLGGTRDDAAGEAFDKTARLLGLGFPGGPAIAAEAAKFKAQSGSPQGEFKVRLPRPMMNEENLDFSFSGLKTAVMREINNLKTMKSRRSGIHDAVNAHSSQTALGQLNNKTIEQLAYELQESITDVLVTKTLKAAQKYKVRSILLGGGVAANRRLSEKFKLKIKNRPKGTRLKINLYIPPPSLCTDNAAYIGSYAYYHQTFVPWQEIQAQPDLTVEVQ